MARRQIVVTHNGVDYSGEVMTIESTTLGPKNAPVFSASLGLKGDGTGVSFGGYALDGKPSQPGGERTSSAYGMDFIVQVMRTVGVEAWEDLRGKQVITLWPGDSRGMHLGRGVLGIAHLTEDRVFIPSEHADAWKATS